MSPVVDANVFMRGRNRPFVSVCTVPEVMEELRSDKAKLNFDLEDIEVRQPEKQYIDRVREKSDEINSPTSGTDEKLLALALQLDEIIITDDKALQNLALHLDVEFDSFVQEKIDERRSWRLVCGNCGSRVEGDRCSKCGSVDITRKLD